MFNSVVKMFKCVRSVPVGVCIFYCVWEALSLTTFLFNARTFPRYGQIIFLGNALNVDNILVTACTDRTNQGKSS